MTNEININHMDWIAYNADGYQQDVNVRVQRHDDGTTTIGKHLHRSDELEVSVDGDQVRLGSTLAGWYLLRTNN